MDLLLWRHAEAEEGKIDLQRRLTARGEKQAKMMGQWIREHQPKNLRILVSPAVRCQRTAEALAMPFETVRRLAPDRGVSDLIAASDWPLAKRPVLIIGHQPTLGRLAALLLSGHESDWTIKKGALWWLASRTRLRETQVMLKCALTAELS